MAYACIMHLVGSSRAWFSSSVVALLGAILASVGGCEATPNHSAAGGSGGEATGGGGSGNASSSSSSSSSNASSSSGNGGMGAGGNAGAGGAAGMGGAGGSSMGSVCGNGMLESPEACDDGNTVANDYCAADCSAVTGACGDGVIQGNETCDDGMISMGCEALQNGGDGKCLPAGMCSPGYIPVQGSGCVPALLTDHVHINVSNTCVMSVMPMEYTVPAGQKLKLSYHNHSQDYPITVWMMYGGGYTDLAPGGTWNEQYEHCFGPSASEGYADISTACSNFRLKIHCL